MSFDTNSNGLSRRTVLKRGLTGGLAAIGFSASASAYHEHRDDYGTVIDVVDAGADPTGEESITPIIQRHCDNDTLLEFPDGRYYMDEKVRVTDFWNFGLVGTGDATLVPANYWNFKHDQFKLFRLGTHYAPGDELLIDNFTVDFTANATGVRPFEATVHDGLTVRNIDIVGQHDSGAWGPGLFRVTDPGGYGIVERFRAPDGAAPQWETPGDFLAHGGPTGILCNYSHRGRIRFKDCVLGPFPDNGLYASGGSGRIIVDGGTYRNSGTASIRMGCVRGDISGANIVVDADPFDKPQEGIRLEYGDWFDINDVSVDIDRPNGEAVRFQNAVGGGFFRNSSVRMADNAFVGVEVNPDVGSTYFKNLDIEINGSNNAIRIEGRDGGGAGLENVSVRGDAGGQIMRHAIHCERNDTKFRGVDIDQNGGNQRRGLALLGDDAFLYDCRFTCTQRGLSLYGDNAWIHSCYSDPYDDSRYSVKIYNASNTEFRENDFPNGIIWA